MELKIQLWDFDNTVKFALYDTFSVANEINNYRLTLGAYSGDAGELVLMLIVV